MVRAACMAVLVLVAAWNTSGTQGSAPKSTTDKPIAALAWLVGGVWTADASGMGGSMQRIETRYEWSDNHCFVRFNTHFVMDKGTLRNYDGQFFWDPQQGALAFWYMDAQNAITQGLIAANRDSLDFTFHGPNFQGKPADLQVQVTPKGGDHYTWTLQEKTPEGWKQLASLEYKRSAERNS
jgi:hypothetical protein